MFDKERRKQELLDRIEVLLAESYRLPRARHSWNRRLAIDWEILLLCREIANLSSGEEVPYWMNGVLEAAVRPGVAARVDRPAVPPEQVRRETGEARAA
ncbi:hypothetical protein GQ464_009110 [Rhodocaloribacter litoris]|uniref:hypothetical protein n=1 Tax=Rhodocaloribacter litoris TaxID=2558931 RepID=UPI0014204C48|nr:hypothetical protein [Rhodocaloribacter litoris]QXD17068.1 hypothetical protein GQ464_009110 [Rhodocaloribacter litoris]GIV60082.1 MAG: hypothetical protein KatS3mg043_1171 [Rhodothermaceae bacterium]